MIGGAEKYMAVCRRCFHSPTATIPASPRVPLKRIASNDNGSSNVNGEAESTDLPKKALFDDSHSMKNHVENGLGGDLKENGSEKQAINA